jgi:hypothetical protein
MVLSAASLQHRVQPRSLAMKNKELQETLVRLNALIAASNGLAQVKNALEKQSAFVQLVRIGQTRLESASIALNTAAESSNVGSEICSHCRTEST